MAAMELSREDIRPHAEGWAGFVRFITVGLIGALAVLALMAIFLT
jgi:Bacterial aa3 type cytochrome c oxidase subunit IV